MKRLIILGLISVLVTACSNKDKDIEAQQQETVTEQSEQQDIATWTYHESKDEMRGTVSKSAFIPSNNSVKFAFPYELEGGSHLMLMLSNMPHNKYKDVMLMIEKGQFSCGIECSVSMKIDDNAVKSYTFSEIPDSNGLISVSEGDKKELYGSLTAAKSVIIEAPFYNEGRQQFKYTIPKLDESKLN